MATPLHKIIRDKFQKTRYATVKEWHSSVGCPLSAFTCTKIIHQETEPALETALIMLHLLGTSNTEMIEICKDHGDKIFWRMMAPCEVSADEMILIEALREDPAKAQIVRSLLAL